MVDQFSEALSFGVVLLELLSGRRTVDKNRPPGEQNLVEWEKPVYSFLEILSIFFSHAINLCIFRGLASSLFQQSRYTNDILHFSHDTITFHPSHSMLSLQLGSNMSRGKIHDTSLQLEWSITSEGFAFIYMEDEQDAEDAIRGLDSTEFGMQRRRLSVEWTKHSDRGVRRFEDGRRSVTDLKPTKTLFVINFDSYNTKVEDIERHFEPYGKLLNVRIRRNFAFVQYESQEDATNALESAHLSKMLDKVLTVKYAQREDGDRRGGRSSPTRRGRYTGAAEDRGRDRSASPVHGRRAVRGSPDYGRASSPIHSRRPERCSPDYGRAPSPIYARRPERRSPDYGRAPSPIYAKRPERRSPDYGRAASPVYASRRQRNSPDYGRVANPAHEQERSRSPVRHSRPSTTLNHS